VLELSWAWWSLRSSSGLRLPKPDGSVWCLSRDGPGFCPGLYLHSQNLVLLCCHLHWTSPHRASLRCWPKIRSPALPSSECLPADQQKTHWVPPALVGDQVLLFLPRKSDAPVWHSGRSCFPALRPFCPAGGRRVRNGRLLHSSLRGQNPE
jgi:hypothetical protein